MSFVANPTAQETDILRIVEYPYIGGSPVTILNLHDGTEYALVGGTLKIAPPERKQQFAESQRRYGGSRVTQETHGNGSLSAEWYIRGDTADESIALGEALLKQIEDAAAGSRKRYIAWQPAGTTNPILYEIRGAATWEPQYRWIEFKQNRVLHMAAGVQIAPLGEGLPMRIRDNFSDPTTKDEYDRRTLADADWTISNGEITLLTNTTSDLQLISKRGYQYGDAAFFVKGRVGAIATTRIGGFLKWVDDNNYIRVFYRATATNGFVTTEFMQAGVLTKRQDSVGLGQLPAGTVIWVGASLERNRIYPFFWQEGYPPMLTELVGSSYGMTTAEAAVLGMRHYGTAGIYFNPGNTSGAILDWEVRPFHYRQASGLIPPAHQLPSNIPLDGIIPGTAKAKANVEVGTMDITAKAVFAMMAWTGVPSPWNIIHNGDFSVNTGGWAVTAPDAAANTFHVAGTSVTRAGTAPNNYGTIVLPATLNAGAHFKVYRRMLRGTVVTLKMTAWVNSGTASVSVGIGSTNGNVATSAYTLTTTPQEISVTYIHGQNPSEWFAFIRSEAATAYTINIKNVRLYQDTTEPTRSTQIDGRGAQPPFGNIHALSRYTGSSTGWATVNEATPDTTLKQTALTGNASSVYYIDPGLIPPDEFTEGEIQIELWARLSVNTAPVKATPFLQKEGGLATRYTNEFGTAGKTIQPAGSSGADYRIIRLGTFTMLADQIQGMRYYMVVQYSATTSTAANIQLAEYYMLPVKRRALSPSGKAADSHYPNFLNSVDARKVIFHDLSGATATTDIAQSYDALHPDHGLGGEFIELDPGVNILFVKLSDTVPDDPTLGGAAFDSATIDAKVIVDVTPRWYLARGS